MQNGTYPWVASSSLGQKSWPPGYQASLTDLFLKKNPLHFGTGISQLAAASSYIEKMSTLSDHMQKCPHPDSKDKPYPCEICQQYFNLCTSLRTDGQGTTSGGMPNRPSSTPVTSGNVMPMVSDRKPPPQLISPGHHHQPIDARSQGLMVGGMAPPPQGSGVNAPQQGHPHRPRQPPTKQFICPVCHKYFTQKGNLKTHMMIHTGEKPYACQVCGKSFTQKGNVDTHMKIHTGEKEFSCESCGKRFTQKGNLKTHIRSVHTKEKPYACGVCGKCFSQKGNMQTHMRTHNKDDRFPCTLCGKTFSQKGNLKTHMQRHTGQLPARRSYNARGSSIRSIPGGLRGGRAILPPDGSGLGGVVQHPPGPMSAFSLQPTPSTPSSLQSSASPLHSPTGNKGMNASSSLGSLPSPRSAVSTPLPPEHCKPSPQHMQHIPSPSSALSLAHMQQHQQRQQNGSPPPPHHGMTSPSPVDEMSLHGGRKSPLLSPHHSHMTLDNLSQQHMPNGLGSGLGSLPHPRLTSPPSLGGSSAHLQGLENESRTFYSAPPTPISTPLSPTPRWLPPDHSRHYSGFQSPSGLGSYNSLAQHNTPLSRLSLLASSATPHHTHPIAPSTHDMDKPLPAHTHHHHHHLTSSQVQQDSSHFHHTGNPDFSQLLD